MSIASSIATTAQAEYRNQYLINNGVIFLDRVDSLTFPGTLTRLDEIQSMLIILNSKVDSRILLDDKISEKLDLLYECFAIEDGGYRDVSVIEQAVLLREAARPLANKPETEWINLMRTRVWDFFTMPITFSLSQDIQWKYYDDAVVKMISARSDLCAAEPNFAFGLQFPKPSPAFSKVLEYKHRSIPEIDLFVTADLALPFFIFESKSNNGSIRHAENQMANAMIKSHDILCSLDVQDATYIAGAIQVKFSLTFYLSFSSRSVDEHGRPFTQAIYIVEIGSCYLNEVDGCLKLLKFVQYVESYGKGFFCQQIMEKLA